MINNQPQILIAEDELFNRNLLVSYLKQEGYESVEPVTNGREALACARSKKFDLILLDIDMPEMNGMDVLRELKSDMRRQKIPIIMISGDKDLTSVVQSIELGAEDYLQKPFDPVLLRARIKTCLEKKRLLDLEATYLSKVRNQKKQVDNLLKVVLPEEALQEVKAQGEFCPRRYDDVAILFCDIAGFTSFCDGHSPQQIVSHLQELFESFEDIARAHGLEKIKTIGDEFMATAGLLRSSESPLSAVIKSGLAMIAAARACKPGFEVRVGVNIGSVVAGIVGKDKFQFDVWGDTVNVAARMASLGNTGVVTLTLQTYMQAQEEFEARKLGEIEVKGKGRLDIVECYESCEQVENNEVNDGPILKKIMQI